MSCAADMERDVRRYLGLRPYGDSRLKGSKEYFHACVVYYGQPFSDAVDRLRRHLEGER